MSTKKLLLRLKAKRLGGHTHVEVYAGIGEKHADDDRYSSLGKCGDLCFRNEEWELFRDAIANTNHTLSGRITETEES